MAVDARATLLMYIVAAVGATLAASAVALGPIISASMPESGAAVYVLVGSPAGMVSHLTLSLSGNGFYQSVPIELGPAARQANASNTTQPAMYTYRALFSGLLPHSAYTLTLNGTSQPYCAPGVVCAMFILRVYQIETFETGAGGTTTDVLMTTNGGLARNTTPPNESTFMLYPYCTQTPYQPPNASNTYYTCEVNERLFNVLLRSVDSNGIATVYYYPDTPVVRIGQLPYVMVVAPGQEVTHLCTGYSVYLKSVDYPAQSADFVVKQGKPTPCPV